MEYLNKHLTKIKNFKPNGSNQQDYFNMLNDYALEEKRLVNDGKLKLAPIFPSETLRPKEIENAKKLKSLLYLNLEFVNFCNLGCEGCWNGYSTESKCFDKNEKHEPTSTYKEKLTTKQYLEIIDQAHELGVQYIDFIGGGEPLISNDFFALVEYAHRKGIKCETFTNGTLIDEETARLLYKYEVIPFVKVYSLAPEKHDKMVNREGAHAQVMEALEHLKNAGYGKSPKHTIVLESIITNTNFNEIKDMWKYSRENDFIPYIERFVGLEYNGSAENLPTPNELKELWLDILEMDQKEYGYTFPLLPLRIGYTCSSAFFSVYVQSDGIVRPCAGSFTDVGDLTKQTLAQVLQESDTLYNLRNLKTCNTGECKNCPYFDLEYCPGCRGMALFHNKDIVTDDPLCFHLVNNLN